MRIGGLASGIDTESIIRDMMKAHRIPLDKITQKKAYTTWQMEDYRSTNNSLRKQSDKLFDTVMKQSTYMKKNVSVSDEKAVSIVAKGSTSDFSGTIEVKQLATQATLQSGVLTDKTGVGNKILTDEQMKNTSLNDLGIFKNTGEVVNETKLNIKVPGKDVADEITFKSSDTLDSVLKQINEKTGATAFYDSATGRIAISAKDSGAGAIVVTGDTAEALRLKNPDIPTPVIPPGDSFPSIPLNPANPEDGPKSTEGKNAEFKLNGLDTTRSSNTFTINGFEISLKQKTEAGSPVTFSSSTNTDEILDSVVAFVNDYNEMIESLNSKIKEKTYPGFHPLSAEEKADLKEKEIEQWEEKAKSGTLKADPAISSLLNNLRSVMSESVNTTDKDGKAIKMNLSDLGITASKNYLDNGKLTINEDKLRAKISENPNAVYDLIGGRDKDNEGIAQKYRTELQDTVQRDGASNPACKLTVCSIDEFTRWRLNLIFTKRRLTHNGDK